VATPVTKINISTIQLQQALLRIQRESNKAADGLEDVVGRGAFKDPNLDVEKRVRSIENQVRRLTVSGTRLRQATRAPGGAARRGIRSVGGIPTTLRGGIGSALRLGGIVGAAATVVRLAGEVIVSNLTGAQALEQAKLANALASSARLNSLRVGPNNSLNNLLKAQEASRVSNTRTKALSFQQRLKVTIIIKVD